MQGSSGVEETEAREVTINDKERFMRFMVIVKATKDSEAGVMPSTLLLTEMGKFNKELVKGSSRARRERASGFREAHAP